MRCGIVNHSYMSLHIVAIKMSYFIKSGETVIDQSRVRKSKPENSTFKRVTHDNHAVISIHQLT
jgi:hypothetical protein